MVKFINCLILCCSLLLHCCGERNTISEGNKATNASKSIESNSESKNLGKANQSNNTLSIEKYRRTTI